MESQSITKKRSLCILGSTGSIGTQALEVVRRHSDLLEVYAITARKNAKLLIKQAQEFQPDVVVIADKTHYEVVSEALKKYPIKVYAGEDALSQVVQAEPIDIVLSSLVGFAGLLPTINAIKAGKCIALANKETLVVAGELIAFLSKKHFAPLLPVDSEHSAIFQCLVGEQNTPIEKIILTASGGPFRNLSLEEMKRVSLKDALNHPNWSMGNKVTIDSASMMNKGFEMIEAHWLFNVENERLEAVVHPQSIIHSMVQFRDGAVKAQLGIPDMKLPIAYAFSFPERMQSEEPRLDFQSLSALTFEPIDEEKFRNFYLAKEAMKEGGSVPCVLNASNEVAVEAFLQERINFLDIPVLIEKVLQGTKKQENLTLEDYLAIDKSTRRKAKEVLKTLSH
ncbi:MAG TPA: 1-deoxy-D-xylulose-5-phosphate reductoisomerase [Porphyromonadaceae bacterium]|nr:1-deoxy-D-xylulose-5-phosphate reductoisomerase [Porphyromonadaceae bacterium]